MREIEKRRGIAAMLSACVPDARDQSRVTHTHADMIRARVFAIASGYEDCDDLDALRIDPAFKMACGAAWKMGQLLQWLAFIASPLAILPRHATDNTKRTRSRLGSK